MNNSTGKDELEEYKEWVARLINDLMIEKSEVRRLNQVLTQIDAHIRSTSDPIPFIIETLKKEYEVDPS